MGGSKLIASRLGAKLLEIGLRSYLPFTFLFLALFIASLFSIIIIYSFFSYIGK